MALPSLPDGLLLELFRYLDTRQLLLARGVCRSWRDLALHPHVWRHRSLTVSWPNGDVLFERAVLSLAPCLQSLEVDTARLERETNTTPETSLIGMALRDVQRLSVSTDCAVRSLVLETDGDCAIAARILQHQSRLPSCRLKRLKLDLYKVECTETVSQELLLALLGASSLTDLEIDFCESHLRWRDALFRCQPPGNDVGFLKKLLYNSQYHLHNHEDFRLDPLLEFLLETHALTLELVDLCYSYHYKSLPLESSVFSLLARCPNLSFLRCPLTDGIVKLAKCSNLVELHLSERATMQNTEELIQYSWTSFKSATHLRYLSFGDLYGEALPLLQALGSSGQSALETFKLRHGGGGSDRHWDQFASVLSGLPQLREIHLKSTPPARFLRSLTPLSAPRLRDLRIRAPIPCPGDSIRVGGESAWDYVLELRAAVFRNPGLHVWGLSLWPWLCEKSPGDSSSVVSPGPRQFQSVKKQECECWQDPLGLPDMPIEIEFGIYSHCEGDTCDRHRRGDFWLRLVGKLVRL